MQVSSSEENIYKKKLLELYLFMDNNWVYTHTHTIYIYIILKKV